MTLSRTLLAALILTTGWGALAGPAHAIPAFARKYGVSCLVCHTAAPRLNAFGETFAGNGFEFAVGEPPRDTVATGDPLLRLLDRINFAIRVDAYAQAQTARAAGRPSLDIQTPYGIKLLSGGAIADKVSYYMYFYMSERGEVAGLEDAYIQFTDLASSGVSLIVGQFQASDPMFKRELRLEFEDYQPYRVRVGDARADLTYDRGVMAVGSPWEGADAAVLMVNGRGLEEADEARFFDRDSGKNFGLRLSQELGPVRVGGYGYFGTESADGIDDRIRVFGPDATLTAGNLELNGQYLRRTDSNPFFASAGAGTTVDAGFVEAVWSPQGPGGRWFFSGLYNLVSSDDPVVSLRLGAEGDEGALARRYQTATASASYLYRRNVRLLGEVTWDVEQKRARFVTGFMTAF